jgi:putative PIN family toxin of toxin-antitoxin system
MRVIVDTNLHVSALLNPQSIPGRISQAWLIGRFKLLISFEQLAEFRATLTKPHLKARIKPHLVGRMIDNMLKLAEIVPSTPKVSRSADPDDDYLLAMCDAGKADLLVTGDKNHLLSLKTHGRTQIITAREFAERLR